MAHVPPIFCNSSPLDISGITLQVVTLSPLLTNSSENDLFSINVSVELPLIDKTGSWVISDISSLTIKLNVAVAEPAEFDAVSVYSLNDEAEDGVPAIVQSALSKLTVRPEGKVGVTAQPAIVPEFASVEAVR